MSDEILKCSYVNFKGVSVDPRCFKHSLFI